MESLHLEFEKAAQRIMCRPKERMAFFRTFTLPEQSAIFNMLSPHVRQVILKSMSIDDAVELLDHLDLRRVHRILDGMKDVARRTHIIKRLKNELHAKVEHFLQFHSDAGASLLHLNYVLLPEKTTIGETAEIIEDYSRNIGKIPEVLVSRGGDVIGEVPLSVLVKESNTNKLAHHVRPLKTVAYTASRADIISLFTSINHNKVAVLDTDGSVIGIVYSGDVIELLGDAPATTLYSFAGVEDSEKPFDSVQSKVRHRYRWLILNLATAFLAAGVVALFEDTINKVVLIAIYMPIIAGMGGNAATQTLAVMVRGITTGEITLKNSRPAIMREVASGLINGTITGLLIAIVALLFGQDPLFGFVVGVSVICSLVVAGFAGTIIPLFLRSIGKDPATSATIFITTATDVLGFIALLGLATLFLV
ncbi:MAG: magnesium transporter [bacterium]|nr:magnesium transporter [bacterium]